MNEALYTLLAAIAATSPMVAKDGQPAPFIVYSAASINGENHLSGRSGLTNTRMQIDSYAATYQASLALAAAIDAAMAGFAYQNISLPATSLYESDTKLFRVTRDYSIWHAD